MLQNLPRTDTDVSRMEGPAPDRSGGEKVELSAKVVFSAGSAVPHRWGYPTGWSQVGDRGPCKKNYLRASLFSTDRVVGGCTVILRMHPHVSNDQARQIEPSTFRKHDSSSTFTFPFTVHNHNPVQYTPPTNDTRHDACCRQTPAALLGFDRSTAGPEEAQP
jgi:hypothetical protein